MTKLGLGAGPGRTGSIAALILTSHSDTMGGGFDGVLLEKRLFGKVKLLKFAIGRSDEHHQ